MNLRFLIEGGEETGSEGLHELLIGMKGDFLKVIITSVFIPKKTKICLSTV